MPATFKPIPGGAGTILQNQFELYVPGASYSIGDTVMYVHTTGQGIPKTKTYLMKARADLTNVPAKVDIYDWDLISNNTWITTRFLAEENDYEIFPGDTIKLTDTKETFVSEYLNKSRITEIINEYKTIWEKGSGRRVGIYMQENRTNFIQVDVYSDYQEQHRDRSGTRKGNPDIRFYIKNIGINSTTWIRIDWKENMSDVQVATYPNFKMTPEIAFYKETLNNFPQWTVVPSVAWVTNNSTKYAWSTFLDTIQSPIIADDFVYIRLHTYEKDNNLYITLYTKNTIPEAVQYAQIQ